MQDTLWPIVLSHFQQEWGEISGAPIACLLLIAASVTIVWLTLKHHYSERIETLKALVSFHKDRADHAQTIPDRPSVTIAKNLESSLTNSDKISLEVDYSNGGDRFQSLTFFKVGVVNKSGAHTVHDVRFRCISCLYNGKELLDSRIDLFPQGCGTPRPKWSIHAGGTEFLDVLSIGIGDDLSYQVMLVEGDGGRPIEVGDIIISPRALEFQFSVSAEDVAESQPKLIFRCRYENGCIAGHWAKPL
jgi:hypothetical protein